MIDNLITRQTGTLLRMSDSRQAGALCLCLASSLITNAVGDLCRALSPPVEAPPGRIVRLAGVAPHSFRALWLALIGGGRSLRKLLVVGGIYFAEVEEAEPQNQER